MLTKSVLSKPTREMRAELAARRVELPSDDELVCKSRIVVEALDAYRANAGKPAAETWIHYYKEFDEDESGFVTFDEFQHVVRHRLGIRDDISEHALQALWCVLDVDNSDQLMQSDMGIFFKLTFKGKKHIHMFSTQAVADGKMKEMSQLNQVLTSQTTSAMRLELGREGHKLLDKGMIESGAVIIAEGIERFRYKLGKPAAISWVNYYKEFDEDGMQYGVSSVIIDPALQLSILGGTCLYP